MVTYEESEELATKLLSETDLTEQITPPPWLDKEKMRRARVLAQKHFFGIFFAHLSGLILLVYVKSILVALLSTGNSRSVTHLFGRYLRTLLHVKSWYEGDVWAAKHPSQTSIMQVRKMHNSASKKLNCEKRCGADVMCLSQFDMLVTQFAFVGLLVLYPRQMGFSEKEEDLEAILHFWRGIGSLLGIEDKYNLCNGSVAEVREMCQTIVENKLKKSITESPQRESIEMSKGIVKAIRVMVRILTYDGLMRYLFEVMSIPWEVRRVSVLSTVSYHMMRLTFNHLLHLSLFALILNNLLRLSIFVTNTNWRKKSIEKMLTEKYELVLSQTIPANTEAIPV